MSGPALSIVTGTRNRPADFRRLVDSIAANLTLDWELVVSDASDNPIENETVATAETWPRIRVIPERPRLGCTKGYNRAFMKARGEFVLWVNDDAIIEARTAELAVEFMRNHPDIGLGAIPYAEPSRPLYHVNAYFDMIYANFGILRREFGNSIGWMDEEFPMYGNDNTLAFRVLLAGKGIAEVNGARIFHYATWDDHRRENNNQQERELEVKRLVQKYGPMMPTMRATYRQFAPPYAMDFAADQTPMWVIR